MNIMDFIIILGGLIISIVLLFVFACCKISADSDEKMEEIFRKYQEEKEKMNNIKMSRLEWQDLNKNYFHKF